MRNLLRDSTVGRTIRFLSGHRYLQYPEELPGFHLPFEHQTDAKTIKAGTNDSPCHDSNGLAEKQPSKVACDPTIVDWYTSDDPANPHNWSRAKKSWASFVILLYSFSAYIGSSLYTASIPGVVEVFSVSEVVATLGLALYVVGYGIGPLLFSPLSEIPAGGRNPPYLISFTLFVILCVPTALVSNFGGLLVLRFLLGFFSSPSISTGGASMGDMYSPAQMPYVVALWSAGATFGPALGPVVGNFAVQYRNWRWSTWELLWLAGPVLLLMLFTLPETSADLILLQRARRLRALTGRQDIMARSEIRQAKLEASEIAFDALVKPWEINIKDPAVLFSSVYTALLYGTYYSFFESFPVVYSEGYGWSQAHTGLAFLSIFVGLLVAVIAYCAYFYFIGDEEIARIQREQGAVPLEARLKPGLIATFLIPLGLFIFAWTARPSIHFLPSLLGVAISNAGVFIIVQSIFMYLAFAYPTYSGSLFAANAFARSALAAAATLFSIPMFRALGIGGGVSLLGGLSVVCIGGMYGIYYLGPRLRARSRFAAS